MTKIVELWNQEELPIKDGVYFSDGRSISCSIKVYPDLVVEKGEKFDLDCFLKKFPDEVTNIDIIKKLIINDEYQCVLGEGSYGSEGFIACLTNKENLEWVMYFEKSNPFIDAIKLSDETLEIESSANYKIIVNINEPANFILAL